MKKKIEKKPEVKAIIPKEKIVKNVPSRDKKAPTKSASIALFYFDDSDFYTLVQNAQVNLQHCIDGYSKSVLLKEDFKSVGQTSPTVLKKPNKAVFLGQLIELAQNGYYIDVYIFAHGNTDMIFFGNNLVLTPGELADAVSKEKTGLNELPIRMVYQMNCYGRSFNQTWLSIGAKTTCGPRYVNFYPNQFNKFASEWHSGNKSFTKSLQASNTESSRTVMQSLIAASAASELFPKDWDKCSIGNTVLGDKACAKSYFLARWLAADEWQNGESGKDNMNYSSYMYRVGQTDLTKNNAGALSWDL
ncbi:hypothetical protein [Algoriphagus sp. oki45]|uniref:hypothetical protein n=1 Tax=Algoriphagus sp. oki45 TaxID=3067294 RepID=UPI0030C68A5A